MENEKEVLGKKLFAIEKRPDGYWFVFEDYIIEVFYPEIKIECFGCVEKREKMKNGNK